MNLLLKARKKKSVVDPVETGGVVEAEAVAGHNIPLRTSNI